VRSTIAFVCALALCACDAKNAAPREAPLEPPVRSSPVDTSTPKVELARPDADHLPKNNAVTSAIPPAELENMIQALGPMEPLMSADEAKQKAQREITAQNAEAELKKLKEELSGGG
jgi:hypothetical protein